MRNKKEILPDFFNTKNSRYIVYLLFGENCLESFILPPIIFINLFLKFSGAKMPPVLMALPAAPPRFVHTNYIFHTLYYNANMKFTHLHTHSHCSLLQALPKIPELIEAAKKEEMEALALTDNGNMYGTIEFYKECKKLVLNQLLGLMFISPAVLVLTSKPELIRTDSDLSCFEKRKGFIKIF